MKIAYMLHWEGGVALIGSMLGLILWRHKIEHTVYHEFCMLAKFLSVLFISGVCGWIAFAQFSFVHGYQSSMQVVLASAFLNAMSFYLLYKCTTNRVVSNSSVRLLMRVLFVVLFVRFFQMSILSSDIPVTREKRLLKELHQVYAKTIEKLGEGMSINDEIGMNYWNAPLVSYYANRNTRMINTKDELLSLQQKPRYFIFCLFGNQDAKELYEYLAGHGRVIAQILCQNIPSYLIYQSIVFELDS